MITDKEYKALRITREEGGKLLVAAFGLGNAEEITTELAKKGLLRKLKVPKGTTDPEHTRYYKLTSKGKKELKEMEMTPRSKETLEKRRRTMQLKAEAYA